MVEGVSLAAKLEELLPPLDQAVGQLIAALADASGGRRREGASAWKEQAQSLRAGLQVLAAALGRLGGEALRLEAFASLWSTLVPLQRAPDPVGRRARKAAACYEPLWRELVTNAATRPHRSHELVRSAAAIELLCARCRAPALRFAQASRYTQVALAAREHAFLEPLIRGLGSPVALAAYLLKYLRFGLAEYCAPCDAFYCAACSPSVSISVPYSDQQPVTRTCPEGHERQVDSL